MILSCEIVIVLALQALSIKYGVFQSIYHYWKEKRERWQKPILRRLQPPAPVNDTNPYNVFRPREKAHRLHTRRMQRRENNVQSFEKLRQVRRNLDQAKNILQALIKREETKRELAESEVTLQRVQMKYKHEIELLEDSLALPGLPSFPSKVGSSEEEFVDSDDVANTRPHSRQFAMRTPPFTESKLVMVGPGNTRREARRVVPHTWLHKLREETKRELAESEVTLQRVQMKYKHEIELLEDSLALPGLPSFPSKVGSSEEEFVDSDDVANTRPHSRQFAMRTPPFTESKLVMVGPGNTRREARRVVPHTWLHKLREETKRELAESEVTLQRVQMKYKHEIELLEDSLALPGLPSFPSKVGSSEEEFVDSDDVANTRPHSRQFAMRTPPFTESKLVMVGPGNTRREARRVVPHTWLHKLREETKRELAESEVTLQRVQMKYKHEIELLEDSLALPGLPSFPSKVGSSEEEFVDSDDVANTRPHSRQFAMRTPPFTESKLVMVGPGNTRREARRVVPHTWLHKLDPNEPVLLFTKPLLPDKLAAAGIIPPSDPSPTTTSATSAHPFSCHGRIGRGGRIVFDRWNPLMQTPIECGDTLYAPPPKPLHSLHH